MAEDDRNEGGAPLPDTVDEDDIPGTDLSGDTDRLTLELTGPLLAPPAKSETHDSGIPIPAPVMRSSVPPRTAHDAWTRDKARRSTAGGEAQVLRDLAAQVLAHDSEVAEFAAVAPGAHNVAQAGVAGLDGALGLVERQGPTVLAADHVGEMRERFALGDFTAALRTAEMILGKAPDHEEAVRTRDVSRKRLEDLYRSRLGRNDAVLEVVVPGAEVRWLGLDHQAAYLLSRIDGSLTLEQLLDMCGMDRLEALKALALLVESRAVELR